MNDPDIKFRTYAIQRMAQRGVSVREVRDLLENGETIQEYPDDQPYPSRLLLGWSNDRPLHVVAAEDTGADRI